MGRHNEYWQWLQPPLGKKWRVLRNAGTLTQSVKGAGCQQSRPSGELELYASLTGFNPRRLKRNELPCNGPSVYVKIFFFKKILHYFTSFKTLQILPTVKCSFPVAVSNEETFRTSVLSCA